MTRTLSTALVLLAGWPAAATAADPLAKVPADAAVVVHLRGWDRTRGRVAALIDNTYPPVEARVLKERLDRVLSEYDGRVLRGLTPGGSVLVALPRVPLDEFPRGTLAVVPVGDEAGFRSGAFLDRERRAARTGADGVEELSADGVPVFLAPGGPGALLVSGDRAAVRAAADRADGLDKALPERLRRPMLDADLAVLVNLAAVRRSDKVLLDFLSESPAAFFRARRGAAAGERADLERAAFFMVIMRELARLAADADWLLVAAEVREGGLAVTVRAAVRDDSPTGRLLKDERPGPLDELGSLPAGFATYRAVAATPRVLRRLQPVLDLASADADDPDDPAAAALAGKLASRPRAQLLASGQGAGETGLEVWLCEDPAKAAAGQRGVYAALRPGQFVPPAILKAAPTVTAEPRGRTGFNLSRVRLPWDLEGMARQMYGDRAVATVLRAHLGREQLRWFGADGGRFVEMTAPDWLEARSMLDDYLGRKKPLARHPAYARVRAGLPERATVLSLSEATSLLGPILFQYRVVAAKWGGKEFGIPDLFRFAPHDSPDAAWLGMALVLEPGQVSFHLWVPVDALYEVHGLARSWFGADP